MQENDARATARFDRFYLFFVLVLGLLSVLAVVIAILWRVLVGLMLAVLVVVLDQSCKAHMRTHAPRLARRLGICAQDAPEENTQGEETL